MKNEILQTALEQFLKFGIRKMSIKKLIEPLGISTKTVYKYFKNKEELLEEVLHLQYNQQYLLLEDLSTDQNIVSLFFDVWYLAINRAYDINDLFYKDLHYYYPELETKTEKAIAEKFANKFLQIIQNGKNEGFFDKNIIPHVAMESIYVLYSSITETELFKRFNETPHNIMLNTISVFIRGLCTEKGIQELEAHIATIDPSKGIVIKTGK